MAASNSKASGHFLRLLKRLTPSELKQRLAPRFEEARRLPSDKESNAKEVNARWEIIDNPEARRELLDADTLSNLQRFRGNIENLIGTVKVPVGLAGPLRVNGLFASGDYLVPLATTEGALVASYNRGASVITECGGAAAMLLNEGVSRAPGFAFKDLHQTGLFVVWVLSQVGEFRKVADATTRYGKLIDTRLNVEGNHVYLNFEFTTGDASGQNMVTIATEAICQYIVEHTPIRPEFFTVEANYSGDKKASSQSFLGVRGRKVSAEVLIPGEVIKRRLHTSTDRMVDYWRMSAIGGVLSGTMGVHGHYANGLTALYLACGQDVACVSESAVGVTRFENREGDLYAAVTLPNLMVGTVGGGTGLPSQKACLEILGLSGAGNSAALAEVGAALVLGGEISIIAALTAGHFTNAHRKLARTGRS
jgi:hydroxymethylglutaryl-CoA reductase (NADPH)